MQAGTYVSRMSTAVPDGCGLEDWIATDEHLVSLVVEQLPTPPAPFQ